MLSTGQLQQFIDTKQVLPLRFGGSLWLLDSRAAVYWPEQDSLLLADLHFEKGSYLSQYASPVPRYDSRATLRTIASLLDNYQPERVICLGDSFHDIGAFDRLLAEDVQQLQALVAGVKEWIWLEGNHDPQMPEALPGERGDSYPLLTQHGTVIHCRHIPERDSGLQIVGHFHPKAGFVSGKRRFRGKSLVTTDKLMLMPALGQYTGGLMIDDEVLTALAPKLQRQCYMLCEQRVITLPAGS
ncbi:ligase-associated DNA damage response endonuclease PdeM [uncultured Alteromonas sp.]|jgi:DNA ligase-associated metallophosphoesterase|uniref:ligase-associated DNA damage response endonuclease PdeM n=1 Tax=uncultured Alteromonas sp. TaxID=179113 RepID=UPI0025E3210E|nr:ligase-associated DNA damage response endonuclease PdeM [uncultured Alteromonas sp.]